jgi:PadR family transcriptional regulator PadR
MFYIIDIKFNRCLEPRGKAVMGEQKDYLGNFEEIVLLAVLRLGEQAYGAKIRQAVAAATERDVSIGAIYATLDRLERKGYLKSWQGEATPERGGRAKRYFQIEGAGARALNDTASVRNRLAINSAVGFDPA